VLADSGEIEIEDPFSRPGEEIDRISRRLIHASEALSSILLPQR